ncbi:hypothetical protein K501DRAFT_321526 [Backusella circina FSU 941]|nr:hypothetical protein K501DRAFT_321526 [Backusella circina FSU 941]
MFTKERVCCCIPVRLGAMLMALIIGCIYLICTILMFVYRRDMQAWSTLEQNVDTPLTVEAFNGVFNAFVSLFIIYTVVSVAGLISIGLQHRKMVRVYHIANWFFVLLFFTMSVAFWIYFKVKQDIYINDCQDLQNMLDLQNNVPQNPYYTSIQIPNRPMIAGGSDKSHCIELIHRLVIVTGIVVFVGNLLQVYWARSIGKYAIALKRYYQHQKLQMKEDDDLLARND